MIYTIYNAIGDHVGGCESAHLDDERLAPFLVAQTNHMVSPSSLRDQIRTAVRPCVGQDFYRYDILYIREDGCVVEQFYAVPAVIGHA